MKVTSSKTRMMLLNTLLSMTSGSIAGPGRCDVAYRRFSPGEVPMLCQITQRGTFPLSSDHKIEMNPTPPPL
jgi:hypothetical protein